MQAVILAGGIGTRLRPLTDGIPKPMVQVGGLPILEYTLSILPDEVDEVILTVGYKKEKVADHFGSSFDGRLIKYAYQAQPLGTGHALKVAQPLIKPGKFLFMYGDDLYHPEDIRDAVQNPELVVLVKETGMPEKFGVCVLDEEGYLVEMIEKSESPPTNLVNIGVYTLDEGIFDVPMIKMPNGEYNLTLQIGEWAKERRLKVIEARFWHPIGYPEDVDRAHTYVKLPPEKRLN